jgi:hypothetical protein
MLCNAALMVRLSNFYSSFKPNFSQIFCSSFKLFKNQTVRLSRVHRIFVSVINVSRTVTSAAHVNPNMCALESLCGAGYQTTDVNVSP